MFCFPIKNNELCVLLAASCRGDCSYCLMLKYKNAIAVTEYAYVTAVFW